MNDSDQDMSLSEAIETAMRDTIQYLARVLTVVVLNARTHKTVIISGWNQDDTTRRTVARYLVGLRVSAIDAALNIRATLEDTEEDQAEVLANVVEIVGEDNDALSDDQKQDERNPWIAEGIWHLCLAVATQHRQQLHLPGNIIALNYAHVKAKDHGLDVAAIYETGALFGLSLVESKAYKDYPNRAINEAASFFREVNTGKHRTRIRATVQIMRTSLPQDRQAQVSNSFWKRNRAYLPNPHYDASHVMDWTNTRPSFRSLELDNIGIEIIVMPHIIDDFDDFFDAISDEMRTFARELSNV